MAAIIPDIDIAPIIVTFFPRPRLAIAPSHDYMQGERAKCRVMAMLTPSQSDKYARQLGSQTQARTAINQSKNNHPVQFSAAIIAN